MSISKFFSAEWDALRDFLTEEEHEAVKILKASIDAVAADIKAHGVDVVKSAFAAAGTAVTTAKAAGKSNAEAGQAALAVLGGVAVKEAVHEGTVALGAAEGVVSADSAHAIVTAAVTAA